MHGRSRRTRAWQGHARARGRTTRMRVATNRAGILLAIMRPGQLMKLYNWQTSYSNWKVPKIDGLPKIGGGGSDFSMNIFGVCGLGQDVPSKA